MPRRTTLPAIPKDPGNTVTAQRRTENHPERPSRFQANIQEQMKQMSIANGKTRCDSYRTFLGEHTVPAKATTFFMRG